jgi:hypothetical protein
MTREDHERTLRAANAGTVPPTRKPTQLVGLPGDTIRAMLNGDYTHGHPGQPPKGYKTSKESRR